MQPLLPLFGQADALEGHRRSVESPSVPQSTIGHLATLTTMVRRLDAYIVREASVIDWACPVPSFGALVSSTVATVGLNPSNLEFVGQGGVELVGSYRRLPTLASLGILAWKEVESRHLWEVLEACPAYFVRNPYASWFQRLEDVASVLGASFYGPSPNLCHLDLAPYATAHKWGELGPRGRSALLAAAGDSLALLLRDSPVRTLILNGQAVIDHFGELTGVRLAREAIPEAHLSRRSGSKVTGYGVRASATSLSGVLLEREILILGYNHNLQSSFGVSKDVVEALKSWLRSFPEPESR